MKRWNILLALTIFPLLVLGYALVGSSSIAGTDNLASGETGAKVRPGWKLENPIVYKNLTIFPVTSDQTESTIDFITLEQGLKSGTVTVTEIGGGGGQRGGAEVNRLIVTNKSGKNLVLIGGEIVLGGKQDRIVGHDCVIEASNAPQPIDVFCVEHGRWQFGRSRSGANSGEGAGLVGFAPGAIAAPNLREKAQAKKDQQAVWEEVTITASQNAVESATGTLGRVFEDKRVNSRLSEFARAFREKLNGKNIVGAVVAINGEVVSADVFANGSLFQAYWPKLLKSFALQAVSSGSRVKRDASAIAAEAFLARATSKESEEDNNRLYRLREHDSDDSASFELESIATGGTLLHFNRISKK
jgi:hypothetical protein